MRGFGFGSTIAMALIALIAILFFRFRKSALESINPASEKNIVNRGANAIVQNLRGDPNTSVGTTVFDIVDSIKETLPFMESERETIERLRKERTVTTPSVSSTQELPKNDLPSDIAAKLPTIFDEASP